MKYRHYAPEAPLELIDGDAVSASEYIKSESFSHIAVIAYDDDVDYLSNTIPGASVYRFGKRDDEQLQAHLLFSLLREDAREKKGKANAHEREELLSELETLKIMLEKQSEDSDK